jgi:hypothetical protein
MSRRVPRFRTAALAFVIAAIPVLSLAQTTTIPTGKDRIVITKRVNNPSNAPIGGVPFVMNVTCNPGNFHASATLSAPNNLTASVNVPANTTCIVVEAPPMAPAGCTWSTSYSARAVRAGGSTTVTNNLQCKDAKAQINVRKIINNPTNAQINGIPFLMNVACGSFHTSLTLTAPSNLTGSVSTPPGEACTVTEQMPAAPKGCTWIIGYPNGQNASPNGTVTVVNNLRCQKTEDRLTVRKIVVNKTPIATPTTPFRIQVTCTPGGSQLVILTPPSSLSQQIAIPAGASCTIVEQPPADPKPCRWQTTYGQQTGGAGSTLTVTNELICRRPS